MKTPHLTPEEMAGLCEGRLAGGPKERAEAHLREGCAKCRAEAIELRKAIEALKSYSLMAVPSGFVERTLEAIEAVTRGPSPAEAAGKMLARAAALVFDSWRAPVREGLRGVAASVRQLVYESEEDQFTIHIHRDVESTRYEIHGQVLLRDGDAGGLAVHMRPGSGRGKKSETNPTGEFVFSGVRPGRYSLRIESSGGDVILGGVELP